MGNTMFKVWIANLSSVIGLRNFWSYDTGQTQISPAIMPNIFMDFKHSIDVSSNKYVWRCTLYIEYGTSVYELLLEISTIFHLQTTSRGQRGPLFPSINPGTPSPRASQNSHSGTIFESEDKHVLLSWWRTFFIENWSIFLCGWNGLKR